LAEKKVSRRALLGTVGGLIGGLAIGSAVGWLAKPVEKVPAATVTVTKTETKTVGTGMGTVTETKTVRETVTVGTGVTGVPTIPKIPLLPPGVRNPWLYDELKGVTIKSVHDAFAGRILEWYADLLKEEVGVEIGVTKLVDIPLLKDEGFSLLEAKSTEYPLIQICPSFIADFVLTGKVEPLDKYYDAFYGSEEYFQQIMPPYREFYMKYAGHIWTIPFDGDVHLFNYLWPFYEKEEFKSAYKEWHPDRKPLTTPETWDDYIMQCKFFKEKVLPDDKTIPGAEVLWPTMVWATAPWGWAFYFNAAASCGVNYFDKDMTTALYPRDRAIEAMRIWVKLREYMPEGVENFGGAETVEYWLAGKVVCQVWFIDINEWGQVPPVKGYLRNALMPGYPDPKKGTVVHRAMMPYNRVWIIPNYLDEKTKKAAFYVGYHVSHWHYSIWNCADYDCGMDPYMYIHLSPIEAEAMTKSNPYKKPSPEWPHTEPLFPDFDTAMKHLLGGLYNLRVGFPQPTFPGTVEYQEILSREFQLALAGSKSPEQAVNDAAAAWEDVRDKYFGLLGKEQYLAIWKDFYNKMVALGYI
jgi:ABC-type glycerol-3-phosphate transport system substrate-binding protein